MHVVFIFVVFGWITIEWKTNQRKRESFSLLFFHLAFALFCILVRSMSRHWHANLRRRLNGELDLARVSNTATYANFYFAPRNHPSSVRFVRGNFRLLSYLNSSATDRKCGITSSAGFYTVGHGLILRWFNFICISLLPVVSSYLYGCDIKLNFSLIIQQETVV